MGPMRRLAVLALLAAITACSAILAFERGQLRHDHDSATTDAAAQTGGGDAHPDGCANGGKLCSGVCVSIFDTNYGCTLTGCDTCPGVAHATGVCSGPSCGLKCENPYL